MFRRGVAPGLAPGDGVREPDFGPISIVASRRRNVWASSCLSVHFAPAAATEMGA